VKPEFVQYVGPAEIHDGVVTNITRQGGTLDVEVRGSEGTAISIRFRDVTEVVANRPEGMMLYALAELTSEAGTRLFCFANWDSEDIASLSVIARDVSFVVHHSDRS
jgi:small ligand-binding sensory domain FIST